MKAQSTQQMSDCKELCRARPQAHGDMSSSPLPPPQRPLEPPRVRVPARRRLATPTFALADDDASGVETRTVTLQSGAVYRGDLVELEPDDHVTLKLATGEVEGEGIPTSSTFRLKWGESTTVVVDAGSKASVVAGWIVFGVGAAGATGGVLSYAAAGSEAGTGATLLFIGGLGVSLLGLALASSTTSVQVRDASSGGLRVPIVGSLQLTPRGFVF